MAPFCEAEMLTRTYAAVKVSFTAHDRGGCADAAHVRKMGSFDKRVGDRLYSGARDCGPFAATCHGQEYSTNVLFCQITGRCRCAWRDRGGLDLTAALQPIFDAGTGTHPSFSQSLITNLEKHNGKRNVQVQ